MLDTSKYMNKKTFTDSLGLPRTTFERRCVQIDFILPGGLLSEEMKLLIILFCIICSLSTIKAQRQYFNICPNSTSKVRIDTGLVYVVYDILASDSVKSEIVATRIFKEKIYYAYKGLKGNGHRNDFTINYFREDDTGAFYQFDTVQNIEIALIPPDNNKEGYECSIYQHFGKADYKIMDYHAEFITPECVYKDVIKVGSKLSQYFTYIDFTYYKRGLGWLGSMHFDELRTYIQSMYIDR